VATAASGNSILVTPQGFSSAADRTGAARRPKGNTLTLRHSGRWARPWMRRTFSADCPSG